MKNKNKLYLYLDDVRTPTADNWEVVRNYDEFVAHIKLKGLGAYFRNCKLPEVCIKVNIEHTYSEGTHMSEEERNKRYMILDKYKTK